MEFVFVLKGFHNKSILPGVYVRMQDNLKAVMCLLVRFHKRCQMSEPRKENKQAIGYTCFENSVNWFQFDQ